MADYVALCRTHGTTLSSDALRQLGGAASSLRSRGVQVFGSHDELVLAAMAVDPWIRPPKRPVAFDGTVLGSWAEVKVYEALRRGLPAEMGIRLHVPLTPGLPRHSCDVVITLGSRTAWVEVLMVGHNEMVLPNANPAVQRYARRWQVKVAWYATKPGLLVTVEQGETYDPERLAGKIEEIRRYLEPPAEGCAVEPVSPRPTPMGGTAHPRHFWTKGELRKVVREVAGTSTGWPTDAAMIEAGHGGALAAIKKRRLHVEIAAACNLRLVHVRGAWTEARVVEELVAWVEAHGVYPTADALRQGGQSRLESARCRLFVGRSAEVRATVEQQCGLAPGGRMPAGSTASQEALAALLRPVCEQLGHFPNAAEMAAAGLPSTVYSVVSRKHGVAAMAARMGVPYAGPARLTAEQAVALLLTAAEPLLLSGEPAQITTSMIRARLGSRGIGILRRQFGTIANLRRIVAHGARTATEDDRPGRHPSGRQLPP